MKTGSVKVVINDRYIRSDGTCTVYLRVRINHKRQKADIPIKDVNVPPTYFDKSSGRVLRHKSCGVLTWEKMNHSIEVDLVKAKDILMWHSVSKSSLTMDRFLVEFETGHSDGDFIQFMAREIQDIESNQYQKPGTIKAYKKTLKKLQKFRNKIMFADITGELIESFDKHLVGVYNNKINTRWAHHKDIKKFLRKAKKRGIRFVWPYEDFKVEKAAGTKTSLNHTEIMMLIGLFTEDCLPGHLQSTLRRFLFSFMCCGLRFSDTNRIGWEHVENSIISIIPQKTERHSKRLIIPLIEEAYGYIENNTGVGRFFPTITETTINRNLKEVARIAGIKKRISFHMARHTFATTFLDNGGKVEVLQHLLGHSKLESTMVYYHITESRKRESMGVFDEYMKGIIRLSYNL